MISQGRYNYHLQDIAEFKTMPQPLLPIQQKALAEMEKEVREFELANPALVKKTRKLSQAIEFAMDVMEALQEKGACIRDLGSVREILLSILPNYPGYAVSEVITFSDGSVAMLTSEGIEVS